ncbi:MAG: SpoIIE family protein phosphatase [Spirochaetales bacterium]|nr:SpoIIE family protein phosphatase [Spirochaetales bacterium]
MVVVWQEYRYTGEESGEVYLSLRSSSNGTDWQENPRFAGPIPFTGKEAPIFSLTVDDKGEIFVAATTDVNATTIFRSKNGGIDFQKTEQQTYFETTVAPRITLRQDGGMLLFVTRGIEESLQIYYSRSENGRVWSDFERFVSDPEMQINFLPRHASWNGRDYVVFQSLYIGERQSFQVYLQYSDDGGSSWSEPVWLSGFEETTDAGTLEPLRVDNQRPDIHTLEDRLAVTWERRLGAAPPQIYYGEINAEGDTVLDFERVTDGNRSCRAPRIVSRNGSVYLVWFDNRSGEDHVILGNKRGVFWNSRDLSRMSGVSTFAEPVVHENDIYLVWRNKIGERHRLIVLQPDRTVPEPDIIPLTVPDGSKSSRSQIEVRWTLPDDSSGIAGFSYSWSDFQWSHPPKELMNLADDRREQFKADEDGTWYLHLSAQDYAGNWSQPATYRYTRDTIPPPPVDFQKPETDEDGYLASNTFSISWNPSEQEQVSGYSYRMEYIGRPDSEMPEEGGYQAGTPGSPQTGDTTTDFNNIDNGLWAFTVTPFDSVGNKGEANTIFLRLNKYVPVTYITFVDAQRDQLERIELSITGRGFSVGGKITQVMLDTDGSKPYDYVFKRDQGLFTVESDRYISNLLIQDIRKGRYRVGVIHPQRGVYFTGPLLELEPGGTVKFGDFTQRYEPEWTIPDSAPFAFTNQEMILVLIGAFLLVVFLFSLRRVGSIIVEGRQIQMEVEALLKGEAMPSKKKMKKVEELKKRGMGLRAKFALFITILIIVIVLMLAIALGYFMLNNQEENLADNLKQRSEVLLESIASGARSYLPSENTLELRLLPDQISAMDDARFATITGKGVEDPDSFDYIWATNDPELEEKYERAIEPGRIKMEDELSEKVPEIAADINRKAREDVLEWSRELDRLGEEARQYALRTDEEAQQRLAELQETIRNLEQRLNERLAEIGSRIGSYPDFNTETLDRSIREYIFYKPIVYRRRGEEQFYRGLVRLGVTTDNIIETLDAAQRQLIIITGIIALIAAGLGIVGAIILSSLTVIPINRLVRGVERIRDTENKKQLEGFSVDVKTKDELSILADTLNQMTEGLVKAAIANEELLVGKEVQKMFIPLEIDSRGNKLTTGGETSDLAEIFGYYEGAKGVSGDYYYYQKLDEEHYGIIKCDVAGKGVPAALIMVQVATIFVDHFRNWEFKRDGIHLDSLAYRINDLIEERGFKGRFAALTMTVMNLRTGASYFCNAGDNIVHFYSEAKQKMDQFTLPESPAAGNIPSMLVEMKAPFQQVKKKIEAGDVFLLFTDGLEEAKRHFRNQDFEIIQCDEPGIEEQGWHDNHQKGSDNEELGIARIHAIAEAVMHRGTYELYKHHNPVPNERLQFDFSSCKGTVREIILACGAVEKVFRIYPDPSASAENRISVDRKIDGFLQEHFLQYKEYFVNRLEDDPDSEYIRYSHMMEDEQYDDLTVLGIRRPKGDQS